MARYKTPSSASMRGSSGGRRFVVVGVDGSPNSVAALRVAVAEASVDGATVEVVCAFRPERMPAAELVSSARYRHTFGPGLALPPEERDAERDARATIERSLALAFPDAPPPVPVRVVTRPGLPRDVLLAAARSADLLVVGARRRPGPLALFLGSTAQACSQHAACPVLVVPPVEPGTTGELEATERVTVERDDDEVERDAPVRTVGAH